MEILKKTGECYLCRAVSKQSALKSTYLFCLLLFQVVTEVFQVDLKTREGKNFKVIAVTQILEESTLFPDTNPSFDRAPSNQRGDPTTH